MRPIEHVVVLASPRVPRRRIALRPGARASPADTEAASRPPVIGGRATVISVRDPFADEAAARSWLASTGDAELGQALEVIGRLLHAQRIATADPWLAPLAREHLIAARIGYGAGEQVADGRWTQSRELTGLVGARRPSRPRRGLGGAEARLAALLAGTDEALACEELTLRVRLDLEHHRAREAALQLLVALDAAIAELSAGEPSPALADRITALRDRRAPTAAAAQAALSGMPSAAARRETAETLGMLEAALRARTAGG